MVANLVLNALEKDLSTDEQQGVTIKSLSYTDTTNMCCMSQGVCLVCFEVSV